MKIKVVLFTLLLLVVGVGSGYITYLINKPDKTSDNYEAHRVCVIDEQVKGIDVSYYQGNIDWDLVKKNDVHFGIARASDGLIKSDPKFEQNWVEMKEAGIIRGAYQFFRPNQDAEEQAKLFVDTVNNVGGFEEGDLPGAIDVEVTGNVDKQVIIDGVNIWLEYVSTYTNKRPIIYSGPYFWEVTNLGSDFKHYSLWTAHYTKAGECPLIPDPWESWDFWQFTGSGAVAGVPNIVDINVYNGSLYDLLRFINDSKIVKPIPINAEIKDAAVEDVISDVRDDVIEDAKLDVIKTKLECNSESCGKNDWFAPISIYVAIWGIILLILLALHIKLK